jgi:hypothetical protein
MVELHNAVASAHNAIDGRIAARAPVHLDQYRRGNAYQRVPAGRFG